MEMPMGELKEKRGVLIEHLTSEGILKSPRIIRAFRETPRHLFVRERDVKFAYSDYPLPIGYSQTISAPSIVAMMTELLEPVKSDRVLEIGSGSGYQAAILSRLVSRVYTVERDPFLAEFARRNLEKVRLRNVEVLKGDGWLGYPKEAPYDKIIAACAVPRISSDWVEQLKEKGIMTAPVGSSWFQELTVGRKIRGRLKTKNYGGCMFVPLRR